MDNINVMNIANTLITVTLPTLFNTDYIDFEEILILRLVSNRFKRTVDNLCWYHLPNDDKKLFGYKHYLNLYDYFSKFSKEKYYVPSLIHKYFVCKIVRLLKELILCDDDHYIKIYVNFDGNYYNYIDYPYLRTKRLSDLNDNFKFSARKEWIKKCLEKLKFN
jgi:hypothetical protein